jgi:hypothetical protein
MWSRRRALAVGHHSVVNTEGQDLALATSRTSSCAQEPCSRCAPKNEDYPLLLHVASFQRASGFGLRAEMIERAFAFRETLDKAVDKPANHIFLGDLNSMGLDFEYDKIGRNVQHARMTPEQEISRINYLQARTRCRPPSSSS